MAKYEIRGLSISSNTWKTVYVAEEVGADYEYIAIDFRTGAHKKPDHMMRHPLGKLPTLTIGNDHVFESNAICRYLARNEDSTLYPKDPLQAAVVDQWMNMFTCHLGRAFNSYSWEIVAKEKFGFGEPNMAAAEEAMKTINEQLPALEKQLAAHPYIAGSDLTVADLYAFAYTENAEQSKVPLNDYPNFNKWYQKIKGLDSIKRAHKKLGRT
jgi:glutathione S-transferase